MQTVGLSRPPMPGTRRDGRAGAVRIHFKQFCVTARRRAERHEVHLASVRRPQGREAIQSVLLDGTTLLKQKANPSLRRCDGDASAKALAANGCGEPRSDRLA
jgi:hypothetical protein